MVVLVTCKNEEDLIRECSQHLSHCETMGIVSNAQGQLTLQSMVESTRISISYEIL